LEPTAHDRTLTILGFHKIGKPAPGGWESWYYISEETFSNYLQYLHDHRWHVIDVAAFLQGLDAPDSLPDRAVLITFDDGYQSVFRDALPCLRRFGYPAVSFVPTAFIGGTNSFDNGMEPEEIISGWDELRELEESGVSIQSHGVTHRMLSKLSPQEQIDEFRRSKTVIESGLAKPVDIFSFPYGDGGLDSKETAEALALAGYRAACLYGGGPNLLPVADRFRLDRIAMGPDTNLDARLTRRK
jgi:peptidoglycan/xylan/chitin deacetylase (PgdA/CDA1 family)